VSGDSPACDLALFAHPFVEGAASERLQRSFVDDRQRCFAPKQAIQTLQSFTCALEPLTLLASSIELDNPCEWCDPRSEPAGDQGLASDLC
jgi:hypothetical protein